MKNMETRSNYADYVHYISVEPEYYGPACTDQLAGEIFERLAAMVMGEFPGISVLAYRDGDGSARTTGPDDEISAQIDKWVSENWTAAL